MLVRRLLINILLLLDSTRLNTYLCLIVLLLNNSYQFLCWLLCQFVFACRRQLVHPEDVWRRRLHPLVIVSLLVVVLVHGGRLD